MLRGRQYVLGMAFGLVAALVRYALIPLWGPIPVLHVLSRSDAGRVVRR